ncbi:peptidase family C50-domain-containing protein [Infundibulicybe gibba]|nr:peptidase family C50-domain-containing protein [Infundibulicybe gibba]
MATGIRTARPVKSQRQDQLAEALAGLTISPDTVAAKGSSKGNGKTVVSNKELQLSSMRSVNSASQALSVIIQSGWKMSSEASLSSKACVNARASARAAAKHLAVLRGMDSADLDVERAAMSVLGKLLALDMFDDAASASEAMYPRLRSFHGVGPASLASRLRLLSIPVPATPSTDTTLLILTSTYLAYSISIFSQLILSPNPSQVFNIDALSDILQSRDSHPTFLAWVPRFSSLPPKNMDSMLTRVYTSLIKLCTSTKSDPIALFSIRAYALSCLAYTTAGVVEPATFWDQCTRFGAVFIKSLPPTASEDVTAQAVLEVYSRLTTITEQRPDRDSFLSGKQFIGFCEYWMSFATKAGDIVALDRIAVAMGGITPSYSRTGEIAEHVAGEDCAALDGAKIYAALSQMTALLEKNGTDIATRSEEVRGLLTDPRSRNLFSITQKSPKEKNHRVAEKVGRALERMRRAAVKFLEGTPALSVFEAPNPSRGAVQNLLVAIVGVLEHQLRQQADQHLYSQALESLFTLARSHLNPADPRTYALAHDHLSRAVAILDMPHASEDVTVDKADYVRCISGAFHNLAGVLYQGGKHGAAISFLKDGCGLGVRAINEHRLTRNQESITADGWKQLAEQLFRRWELLGVCYSKIGDRQQAFASFTECVKNFPFSESGFAAQAGRLCLGALFETSNATRQLATIVEKMTHLGTLELLLEPARVSVGSLGLGDESVTGALLEWQIEGLQGRRWKEGVQSALRLFLRATTDVYNAREKPVRRARVLLKHLDFHYHAASEAMEDVNAETIGEEVDRLLQQEDLAHDAGLASFCVQYLASAHLWLALHAHRRGDPKQGDLITDYTNKACSLLKTLVLAAPSQSPKLPKKNTLPKKVPERTQARRKPNRLTASKPPETPKVGAQKARRPVASTAKTPRGSAETPRPLIVFDNFEGLLYLLQSTARICGLLGLTMSKVQILDVTRKLCERYQGVSSDGFATASLELAHEYVELGRTKRAGIIFNQTLDSVRTGKISDRVAASFFLRAAEAFAASEDINQSSAFYCEAFAAAERMDCDESGMTSVQRVQMRVSRMEQAAIAAHVFGLIQHSKGEATTSLEGMLQALRLWNRAFDALARLRPTSPVPTSSAEDNPFEVSSSSDTGTNATPTTKDVQSQLSRRQSKDGMEWRICEGLLSTFFALSHAYFIRGSVRESEYFLQQAYDLAESLNVPAMMGRAMARKGELQLHQLELEGGLNSVQKAAELLGSVSGIDVADIQRLRGDFHARMARASDAEQIYRDVLIALENLNHDFKAVDDHTLSYRKSLGLSTGDMLVPELLAAVLRQHIWMLRHDGGETFLALLNRFLSLPHTTQTKTEENALVAKLNLHDVYGRFRADMFLSSLSESTIALPMGMSRGKNTTPSPSPSIQDILATLDDTENLLWENLKVIASRGSATSVRETAVSLALIHAYQGSLGKPVLHSPILVTGLLDTSTAITLRREILEAIHHKFPSSPLVNDLHWPQVLPDGTALPPRILSGPGDSPEMAGSYEAEEKQLKDYWSFIQDRYRAQGTDTLSLSTSNMASLPRNWTIIHINVTDDKGALFITRQQGGDVEHAPLVFCVPLKGRRDNGSGEDEDQLTFEDALDELKDIIRLSDEGTKAAIHIKNDPAARTQWWKTRTQLDIRLRELLENVEFCWLGAFKTILSPRPATSPELISGLRERIEKIFQRPPPTQAPHISLDETLVQCFSTLSPKCRDEELEDLAYFILDLYQFHGVVVAIAEVDVVQVVLDLRAALEDYALKLAKYTEQTRPPERMDEHVYLILDKNVHSLPWESIPILRGRSVSRIPSVSFLHDRLEYARRRRLSSGATNIDGASALIDPRNGYSILNPSGDLKRTEDRFKEWTGGMHQHGWQGLTGKPPSEQQFLDALRTKDLVVYFGHGGGEQYVRSHKIRHLPSCAATMLWGCSSGLLREMGEFDPIGTPYNYMLAGCPSLVANMWDVTDRDIDKFSQSVFDKLGLTPDALTNRNQPESSPNLSIVAAIAQSRDVCKLTYLTGAAPVVYGIPFYI